MTKLGQGMRAFVKCPFCGHIVYTDKVVPLLSLLLSKNKYTCKECGNILDFIPIYLCSRLLGDFCDKCEFRFRCYSKRDVTEEEG